MKFVANLVVMAAILSGWAGRVEVPETVPELRPGVLQGYLEPAALPNSALLLPAPPDEASAAMARDLEASATALTLQGTPRWELAAADAVLRFPAAAQTFACALGVPITEQDTPNLYMLLRRSLADAGLSTYAAKNLYQRKRPFVANGQPTCTPDEEPMLASDGSYPSGHAALGWAWSLILAELAPERADALLARGRAFSESEWSAMCTGPATWPRGGSWGQLRWHDCTAIRCSVRSWSWRGRISRRAARQAPCRPGIARRSRPRSVPTDDSGARQCDPRG